jgi:hypothetical protein
MKYNNFILNYIAFKYLTMVKVVYPLQSLSRIVPFLRCRYKMEGVEVLIHNLT